MIKFTISILYLYNIFTISILTDLNNATLVLSILFGACEIDLSIPQSFYITDRSNAILLLWLHLYYVLESTFCAV